MGQVVSCVLPQPVSTYLIHTYHRPAASVLLEAAKSYLGVGTSTAASTAAAHLAVAGRVTKTDIYRAALIKFDPNIGPLWPTPPSANPGAVARSAGLMRIQSMDTPETSDLGAIIQKLQALQADVPNLSNQRIAGRMDTIIRKAQQLHTQMARKRTTHQPASPAN